MPRTLFNPTGWKGSSCGLRVPTRVTTSGFVRGCVTRPLFFLQCCSTPDLGHNPKKVILAYDGIVRWYCVDSVVWLLYYAILLRNRSGTYYYLTWMDDERWIPHCHYLSGSKQSAYLHPHFGPLSDYVTLEMVTFSNKWFCVGSKDLHVWCTVLNLYIRLVIFARYYWCN